VILVLVFNKKLIKSISFAIEDEDGKIEMPIISAVVLMTNSANLSRKNATVTVDGLIEYQTIDGFGGSGAYEEGLLKNLQEPKRTEAANLLFSDLGTSIYRLRAWTKIESVNDDDDPNHFNWPAFNFNTDQDQVWTAIQAKNRGVTRFIASVWSPPGWMKDTGIETNGGYLLPNMYEEFAEWLAAYVIGYKTYHGIDIGWVSIQNEPDYTAIWESCKYTPEQMKDVIKVVGTKFSKEGINTKIVIPETTGSSEAIGFISTIMSDPEAAKYVDVFANHIYNTDFFSPDTRISSLQAIAKLGNQYNKPIWQTEYCSGDIPEAGTFKEALFIAQHIHNVLTHENGSAYLVWGLFWHTDSPSGGLVIIRKDGTNYIITPKFYAAKQYFKFIDPGSKRIAVVANNSNILASAYMNRTNGNVTIVAINKSQNPITTTFNLRNVTVDSFKQYRTSTSENCKYIGDIAASNNFLNVDLPSESITTLAAMFLRRDNS
jgi:glucuronoarabinoxylan endo-1,4-beta-xylanase